MTDKLIELLSNGMTVRQRDFVKALLVTFPLVFCGFDILDPTFASKELFTKAMYTVSACIILNSISLIFLWIIHWLARCPMWNGVFYFVGPAVITALDFDFSIGANDNFSTLVKYVINHYTIFFLPFLLYALGLSIYYRLTHKADNRPNPFAPDKSDNDTEDKPR